MEVQERFDTTLVTASRKHEREGELIKMCRKGPKRFIFVLFNDLLIYGAQKLASSEKYVPPHLCVFFSFPSITVLLALLSWFVS